MTRIASFAMPITDMIMAMCDGNPGAITALAELAKSAEAVDPDSALGGYGPILSLDTHGIYGSHIWMLYSDVCGRDVIKTLGVLRAIQLGLCSEREFAGRHMIGGSREESNAYVDRMVEAVRERLPRFGAAVKVER